MGTVLVVLAYFGTQMRFINTYDRRIRSVTRSERCRLAFSLIRNFSLASAPLEIVWTAISRPGIFKGIRGAAEKDTDAAIARSGSKS